MSRGATLVVVGLLALPAVANGLTFGANLATRVASSPYTCGYPPYYPPYNPYGYANPPWAPSCTFFSSASQDQGVAEGDTVPFPDPAANGDQYGVITEVRIKTGNYDQPGPAKLTVLRSHRAYSGREAACCIGAAETATFILKPNAIVHVATNLPVESVYDADQKVYTFDTLALSILDSTTPIPAEFSNDPYGYCSGGLGGAAYPGSPAPGYVQTGQERFESQYGVCGYLILMQADVTIYGPPGQGVQLTGTDPVRPGRPFTIGRAQNPPTVRTQQTLTVPAGGTALDAFGAASNVVVARGSTTIVTGHSVKLTVRLTSAGAKLLRQRHQLNVKVTVKAVGAGGRTQTVKRIIALRLKPH